MTVSPTQGRIVDVGTDPGGRVLPTGRELGPFCYPLQNIEKTTPYLKGVGTLD